MRFRWILAMVAAVAAVECPARASIFMNVAGIPGESDSVKFANWIDVADYAIAFGATPSSGGGGGGGSSDLTRLDVSANVSKASPKILLALLTGQHITKVELAVTKLTGGQDQEFARWTFEDVVFTGFKQSAVGNPTTIPRDVYSLFPALLTYKYTEYDNAGGVVGTVQIKYDLKNNVVANPVIEGDVPNFVFATGTYVPEPSTGLLLGSALFGVVAARRRSRTVASRRPCAK